MNKLLLRIATFLTLFSVIFLISIPVLAQDGGGGSMVDLIWVNGVLAFFLPLVISFLKNQSWSPQVTRVFALVISAVVGVVTVGASSMWEFNATSDFFKLIITSITEIWVVAQVAYLSFWKGTTSEVKASNALYSGSEDGSAD